MAEAFIQTLGELQSPRGHVIDQPCTYIIRTGVAPGSSLLSSTPILVVGIMIFSFTVAGSIILRDVGGTLNVIPLNLPIIATQCQYFGGLNVYFTQDLTETITAGTLVGAYYVRAR